MAGWIAAFQMPGDLQLAAILLGFGEPLDPPLKHRVEADNRKEGESDAPAEPPAPGA